MSLLDSAEEQAFAAQIARYPGTLKIGSASYDAACVRTAAGADAYLGGIEGQGGITFRVVKASLVTPPNPGAVIKDAENVEYRVTEVSRDSYAWTIRAEKRGGSR